MNGTSITVYEAGYCAGAKAMAKKLQWHMGALTLGAFICGFMCGSLVARFAL